MEQILEKYRKYLETADFEVIHTPKLGWIIIRTSYFLYSDPVKQIHSAEELEAYIKLQIQFTQS